ncbi:MAG: response regulator transcription factor [Dechloromonas sp.]|jgi:two-component system nitrate/nitrite response regulator NarL|uniref:helix-turn-helix transcriptional regulator n=1 Tax=Azonexus sp. TaxID=1872668 RepID=UPI0035B314F3|nr:response regulator transcription factor [Dechloromonas sp.]
MDKNLFVTSSRVPPRRWLQAFPQAEILPILPSAVPAGTVAWLHNMTPAQLPGGRRPPGVHFVVLHDEPSDEAGLAALSQGAVGYCNAHATPELLHTVESVVRSQGLWVGESLLNRLLGGISNRLGNGSAGGNERLAGLSSREREIALCVARGESNKEIARELNLAERTIKLHLTSIFEKLQVRDRLQLALRVNSPE